MEQVQQKATIPQGGPALSKVRPLVESFRITTRIWFDTIPPLVFIALMTGGLEGTDAGAVIAMVVMTVLFHGAGNYLNDLADIEVDRSSSEASRNQRAIVKGELTRRDLGIGATILIAITFAIAAFLPWPTLGLVAILTLLNVAYNLPPASLSSRGIVLEFYWPLIWAFMFFIGAAAVEASRDGIEAALPYLAFVAVFMGVGEGITQDIRDADNDAAGGRNTTPVRYGVPRSVTVAWIVQLLSIGIWVWFCVDYPIETAWAVAGTVVLVGWQAYFGQLASVLVKRFDKDAARMTHVGPILVFTVLNLLLLGSVAVF